VGHPGLLLERAVVLDRQDHRIGRRDEGVPIDRLHHRVERYLCGERVSVIDHRETVVAVPAVQFDASASGQEDLAVQLHRRLAFQLVSGEVSVVGGCHVVSRHRPAHLALVRNFAFVDEGVVVLVHQVSGETLEGQAVLGPQGGVRFVSLQVRPTTLKTDRPSPDRLTCMSAFTCSSVQTSICLVSRNFVNVDIVITCELLVSIPAQFVKMLAAAIASNIFFWELTTDPSSSARLFLVNSPSFCNFFNSTFVLTPFTFVEVFTAMLR
jgi:hypothetical protein